MKYEQKAKNAIKWIENLPNYKQAPIWIRERLGDKERGYSCLGAGCEILGIPFNEESWLSSDLKNTVGLKREDGYFIEGGELQLFYDEDSLVLLNDETYAGFLEIANLMKKHPTWMFENEVAKIIAKHFA